MSDKPNFAAQAESYRCSDFTYWGLTNLQTVDAERKFDEILIDMMEKAYAAGRASRGEGQWRDIATAPKDERILLWNSDYGRVSIGIWNPHSYARKPVPYWDVGRGSATLNRMSQPTHWQPLPPPPPEQE